MLTSLVLTLVSDSPAMLPLYLGRASHAAFLRLIAGRDPALAERLHTPDAPRPFTCSSLWGARRRGPSLALTPGAPTYLRFTGLTAEVSSHLLALAAAPPAHIELDRATLSVTSATTDATAHEWAGQTTYDALAARRLLPGAPSSPYATLRFHSPTGFRSGGQTVPVPLPGLVFGSLVERWNAFAPVAVADEMRRFAEECLAISRYQLSTRALPAKGRPAQIGCVGWCRYTATHRDRYWLGVLQLLTEFAFYAGVGYQTAAGMGQARPGMDGSSEMREPTENAG